MCGRFSLGVSTTTLAQQFNLADLPSWVPRYKITPTQEVLTILKMPDAPERQARLLRWGLVPPWAEGPAVGSRMINARAETVATKPAYRRAFKERRCLVLADGFYEWIETGPKQKQPYLIRMLDQQPFAFAGLWERWHDNERGDTIESCTIITCPPNAVCAPIHDRMPAILAKENYAAWLGETAATPEELKASLKPCPEEGMEAVKVSTKVNQSKIDAPEVFELVP